MVLIILKTYMMFLIILLVVYFIRHYIFSLNRLYGEQRLYYQDIIDSDLPDITVLIPMHNEEKVARNVLDALIESTYPRDRLEVLPVNDHSQDGTRGIIDAYAAKHSFINPLHRYTGLGGKQNAVNDALELAKGEIIIVFDADYVPPRGILRDIAVCFKDPEVGAVMGRVIPINTSANLLTRMLDIERSGGYQVDQQARHNLKLMPQYGGTVGGFRKDPIMAFGGFDPNIITEDTELTFRLFINGWKVVYANRVECYEESPESWTVRARQIRRWSRGHNQVMFRYMRPLLNSRFLNFREKLDGCLLLCIYFLPGLFFLGMLDSLALFFMGDLTILPGIYPILFGAFYNSLGNFAPFYEVGIASFLDGSTYRIRLLPFFIFNFMFSLWYVTLGCKDAIVDVITGRTAVWQKTRRFRKETAGESR